MTIRNAELSDAGGIADIYNYYIEHTHVTFEEKPVNADDIRCRIKETKTDNLPYLTAVTEDGKILGYAYASKWKGRCAYRYSVEVTVYLSTNATGKGLGKKLYLALFAELRARSYHVAIGGVSLPNEASIALHESMGMKKVAHFKEVGFKFGQWVDVGYWQGMLNESSPN